MMDIAVAKLLGVAVLFVIFVITVLLMPRILGENPPSTTVALPADDEPLAPPAPARAQASEVVRAQATESVTPRPAGGLAQS
jgi:hypothetical protein